MKKNVWIAVALVVVIGIIVCAVQLSGSGVDVDWSFQEQTPQPVTGAPRTKVTATINDIDYDAGTYNGTCVEIEKANLPSDEVAGIVCWWAGFGDEIGVFVDGEMIAIKRGEIQEGDEGTAPFRGNFETLVEI